MSLKMSDPAIELCKVRQYFRTSLHVKKCFYTFKNSTGEWLCNLCLCKDIFVIFNIYMYLDNLINDVLYQLLYCIYLGNLFLIKFVKCVVLLHPNKEHFLIYTGSRPRHCSFLFKIEILTLYYILSPPFF